MGFGNLLVKYGLVEQTASSDDFDADVALPPVDRPEADPLPLPDAPPDDAPRVGPAAGLAPDADLSGEVDETLLAELEQAIGQVETEHFDYTDYVQLRERLEETDASASPEKIARTVSVFAEAQGATVDDVVTSAEAARTAVEEAGAHAMETTEAAHAQAVTDADAEVIDLQTAIETAEREIEAARARIVEARKRLVDLDDETGGRTAAHAAKTASIARTVRETLAEIDADIHTLQAVR